MDDGSHCPARTILLERVECALSWRIFNAEAILFFLFLFSCQGCWRGEAVRSLTFLLSPESDAVS